MTSSPIRISLITMALTIVVVGCTSAPPLRMYVLGDPASSAPVVPALSGRTVVRLSPVSVPDYLDTEDILIRSGANEVKASPTGRWAERLSVGVTQALTGALAASLPSTVIVTKQPIIPPAQQIVVDIEVFEIRSDGRCLLIARWSILGGDNLHGLGSGHDTFVEQAADASDAAIASAMTRAIDRLATQIVAVETAL
jgi:cholesterol transport system auxiliary component